jgi:hypothetical protein
MLGIFFFIFFSTVLVWREHIGDHEFGDEERRYDPISRIRKAGLREEAQLSKNLFHIFSEALGHLFLELVVEIPGWA